MTTTNPTGPLAGLADALRELVEDYPTDAPDHSAGAVVIGLQSITVQPGHVEMLTRLVRDELRTIRNAHPDGIGECGHCGSVPPGFTDDADRSEDFDLPEA